VSKSPLMDLRVLPDQKDKDAYDMPGRCRNCGWTGMLRIAKGERAPRDRSYHHGDRPAICQRCHVSELVAA